MWGNVTLAQRVQLFRELATLVQAGMSLAMALATLQEQKKLPALQRALQDAARSVATGKRFSEAMARHPHIFPELSVALIRAGEESGRLDTMLGSVADYLERELEFRQTLSRETLYPKLLLAAVILIPLGAKMFIAAFMSGGKAAWAIAISFFLKLGLYVLLPLLLLYYVYQQYVATGQGRRVIDYIRLRVPVLGAVTMKLSWARLCRALAALYAAGLNIRSAVQIAARTAANRVVEETFLATRPALERGEKLSDALQRTGFVPPLVLSMLRTGEQTGQIDITLEKVADYFEAEAYTTLRKSMTAIVPLAVVIFGIIVLMMAVQFYSGYFSSLLAE